MKTPNAVTGLILVSAGLALSGCYTQFATNDRDPYSEREQGGYTTEDTTGAAGYYDSRERFYSDYSGGTDYYMTQPYSLSIGATFWGPWWYPGYGYGNWWFYDPWYYPYYPAYHGGYWAGGYYPSYPYYGGGGYPAPYGKPSGVRTFGSGRYTGPQRVSASGGSTSPGLYRQPAATTPGATTPTVLPSGYRAVTPPPAKNTNATGREGGSRPAPSSTKGSTHSGSSRNARVPAYVPPPPPSNGSGRQGGERPSGGNRSYTPPSSSTPSPSSTPSGGSGRDGGSRSGGSQSGSSGGRSGSRR